MEQQEKIYLGIDWGEERIGVAIGNNITNLASPFGVVHGISEILHLISEEDIDELVIGEPKKMQSAKLENEKFTKFVDELKKNIDLPVHFVDERLTSKAADALVGDKKTKAPRDAIAAMIILQDFLEMEKR